MKKDGKERNSHQKLPCTCMTKPSCRVEAILTIDERGQMVLPKDVRERANMKPGDKLALVSWEKDDGVCCLALLKTEHLSGMVKDVLAPLMNSTGE